MTRQDLVVERIALSAGLVGIASMVVFIVQLLWSGYHPFSSPNISVSGQVGDFVGGVAGSLFALAAGMLFYLTLTLQRREFRNSLEELKLTREALDKSAAHQESTLGVMREEKEFGLCMRAISDLRADWNVLDSNTPHGNCVQIVKANWPAHFFHYNFLVLEAHWKKYVKGGRNVDLPLAYFIYFDDCAKRAAWIANAIKGKTLALDDRKYLAQVFRPVLHDINEALIPTLDQVSKNIDESIARSRKLASYNDLDTDLLKEHQVVHVQGMKRMLDSTVDVLYEVLNA